jgi:hypothetical protein
METPVRIPASHRPRAIVALASVLSLSGVALVAPAGAFAAQGDNDTVINVIEQVTPAIVTIQTPPTTSSCRTTSSYQKISSYPRASASAGAVPASSSLPTA